MKLLCIVSLLVLAAASAVLGQTEVDVTGVSYDTNIPDPGLILTFSETVDTDDFACADYEGFVIQNAATGPAVAFSLSTGGISQCTVSDDMDKVTFHLSLVQFNELFTTDGLFGPDDTTYLAWDDSLFLATSDYTTSAGVLPATFIEDTSRPQAVPSVLDLNSGYLSIAFNSPVNISSASIGNVFLSDGAGVTLQLPWVPINGPFSKNIFLMFPLGYQETFANSDVCVDIDSCYVFFNEDFISDPYDNTVIPISPDERLQVDTFIPDTSAPYLAEFSVTFGAELNFISLTFSEPVLSTTLNPTAITFADTATSSSSTVTLTDGAQLATEEGSGVVGLQFITEDLTAIDEAEICQTVDTCFISFTGSLISDYSLNLVVPIIPEIALLASDVVISGDDNGDLSVSSAEFNHDGPSLILTFSGAGNLTCDLRLFTFQNHHDTPTAAFTPAYPGSCRQFSSSQIEYRLDKRDYLEILDLGNLLTTIDNSYLRWTSGLGYSVNVTAGEKYLDSIILDITAPVAIEFDIDLNRGIITVIFDSIVDPSTFDFTGLVLHNTYNLSSATVTYQLTGGFLSDFVGGTTICVGLTGDDALGITTLPLCTSVASCYLSVTSEAVSDHSGNVAPQAVLQVGRLRRMGHEGKLRVDLQSFGCLQDILLAPSEPLIIRVPRETVISVSCDDNDNVTRQLSWKPGTLKNVVSPFNMGSVISSAAFPEGLNPENYGVFVCSSPEGYTTENFILDGYPFIGSPDGSVAVGSLYSPLKYTLHYSWAEGAGRGMVVSESGAENTRFNVSIVDFVAVVTVNATDVLYSLTGDYVVVLVDSSGEYNITFPFSIAINDPTILPSETRVEIDDEQSALTLTCTPSSPLLPILWREGERRLTQTTAGVNLTPTGLHHQLTLDLSSFSLTGEDIVCEVVDPEDDSDVVASATIEISVPLEGVEKCEAEEDEVWGIEWDATNEGSTDEQGCPLRNENEEVTGIAKRRCLEGAVWGKVDVSDCASKIFSDLLNQVELGLEEDDPEQRERILSEVLPVLEKVVTPNKTLSVFPRDLVTSNDIVGGVVSRLTEDVVEGVGSGTLQTGVLGVLDKLLSEEHTDNWRTVTTVNNKSDGSQLLKNAEGYGEYVALAVLSDSVATSDTVTLTEDNIEVSAQKLDTTDYSDIVYPRDGEEDSDIAQINIPATHLSDREASAVVNMRIENIEGFLPEDDEGVAAAQVISSQVIAEKNSSATQTPVQLTFTTFPMKNARNPRCVYWNFDKRKWLKEGVKTLNIKDLGSYSYRVQCESSHLTSFSVLVDIAEEEEEEEEFELTVAGYVGAGVLTACVFLSSNLYTISLIASCVGKFKSVHVIHLAHLGISLSLFSIGVLLLTGLTRATDNTAACTAVAALLQYFFTAAFTWTLLAVFLALVLVAKSRPVSLSWKTFTATLIVGIVIPAIPTAISVGLLHDDYGEEGFCWIEDEISDSVLWANVAPMAALFVVSLLLVLLTVSFAYIRSRQSRRTELTLTGLLIVEVLTVLLGVLVAGLWASGLVMVNGTWDPAEWLFLACSCALGLTSLAASMLLVCCGTGESCNIVTLVVVETDTNKDENKYWSDPKPLIKEKGQTDYSPEGASRPESAYAMMGVPPSEEDMEAMMEGGQQEETALQ